MNRSALIRCSSRRTVFGEGSSSPLWEIADFGVDLLSGKLCFRSLEPGICVGEAGRAPAEDPARFSDPGETERTSSSSSMLYESSLSSVELSIFNAHPASLSTRLGSVSRNGRNSSP